MTTEAFARLALEASSQSYESTPAPTIGGGAFERLPSNLNDPTTGFRAEVYRNTQTGDLIVAFTGTQPSANDALADLNVGVTQWERNREAVSSFIAANLDEGAAVNFTGHSLGGALAQFAAYDFFYQ